MNSQAAKSAWNLINERDCTIAAQSDQISKQGAKIERLRKMLWAIIWDNKDFTQEELEWAGRYELDIANARITVFEALNKEQSERIAELET